MKFPFSSNNSRILPLDKDPAPPAGATLPPNESENNSRSPDLDPEIWSRLPEDCLDRILARLPLPSVFRLRLVCKRWNALILSDSFLSLQSSPSSSPSSSSSPSFLLCTHGRVSCIFNFALHAWHFVPVPRIILPITIPPVSVVSASPTLLVYANQVAECSTLFVCNPFTKSLRELPPMPRIRLIHKLSITTSPTRPYSIMVAGEDAGAANQMLNPHVYKLFTDVYDSETRSWGSALSPPPDAKFGSDPGVWVEPGKFYCITELPYGMVCFDLATRVWGEVRVEMPPLLGCPTLVVHRKTRLMMLGRVQKPKQGILGSLGNGALEEDGLRVWELKQGEGMGMGMGMWVEVSRAPAEMWGEFASCLKPRTPMVSAGVGDVICLTTHLSPRVLVLDVPGRKWSWLPGDPLFPRLRNFHLLGFSFEPRLDSQP